MIKVKRKTIKQIRQNRLKELVHILENHKKYFKEVAFYMGAWAVTGKHLEYLKQRNDNCKISNKCGTVACALASAALYAPFNKEGLKMSFTENGVGYPVYGDIEGMEAGSKFFHITIAENEYLFAPETYNNPDKITRAQVISRVKALISQY